ncbi:MAG TPA: DMT family transporter [Flavobacteriales bacterium]|nr:DMT family transporter [Flavobacteriales bacterium]
MNKTALAHLSVFGSMLIYGANYVIMKKVTPEHVLPFGLVVYRVLGALFLFFIAASFIREKMQKKDVWFCALLAFFGVAANQMLFINGLSRTSPINASIMMLTSPILVLIIAVFMKRENLTIFKIIGMVLGFTGAGVVILYGASKKGESSMEGDLMILANALSWGIFLVLSKPLMMKYHTITVMKWVFLFGALYTTPIGIYQAGQINVNAFDSLIWFNFLYVIIATTFLAYLLNTYALKALSSSVVGAYIYLQPVLATIFGIIFGMGGLNIYQASGALGVFAGVFLISYGPLNKRP